ncbi:hypothetical protein [Exiguobacterium mexicanum]
MLNRKYAMLMSAGLLTFAMSGCTRTIRETVEKQKSNSSMDSLVVTATT